MTEFSFPWGCTASGDGGPSSLTVDIMQLMNKYMSNFDPVNDCVVYWTQSPYTGLLNATNPGASIVRIDTGIGMVEGWLYENDSNVDFDVSGGNANATDLIVLRRSNPGTAPQTVRLAHLRGPAAGSATPTQTASVWEVPIWEVVLDGSGNFSSLNDVRGYVNATVHREFAAAHVGYNVSLTSNIIRRTGGVELPGGDIARSYAAWEVPENFISNLICIPIAHRIQISVPGVFVYVQSIAEYATCLELYNTHSDTRPQTQVQINNQNFTYCFTEIQHSLASATIRDFVNLTFERDGADVLDTNPNSLFFAGWEITYLGYKR